MKQELTRCTALARAGRNAEFSPCLYPHLCVRTPFGVAERHGDGSRGFQATVGRQGVIRRGATVEGNRTVQAVAPRRGPFGMPHRGMNPTATIMASLRDGTEPHSPRGWKDVSQGKDFSPLQRVDDTSTRYFQSCLVGEHRSGLKSALRDGRAVQMRRTCGGFTLIELLVMIAIIGLLAAMLLPVLSRARAKAQQVDCMSRQKQWALAFRMYVDDNENLIPREGYRRFGGVEWDNWNMVRGRTTAGTNDSEDVWYNALPDYAGVPRAAAYAPVSPVNKHAAFYSAASLFHCPAAKFPVDVDVKSANYFIVHFSIAMNSQLIEFPHGPTINFNQLRDEESRTVLFLDNLLDGEKKVHPWQDSTSWGQPSAYADRFSARHSNGGNLAFADGHVAWFPGTKVVETNPESPLRGGPVMPPVDIVWEPKYDF